MKIAIKPSAKSFLQSITLKKQNPILVPSIGRSGSTVIYKSIVHSLARRNAHMPHFISRRLCSDSSWTLGEKVLKMGVVYKTHDYPSALQTMPRVRAVFCFGSIVDSIQSVYSSTERFGPDWTRTHFANLKSSANTKDILNRDALNFEAHMDAWFSYAEADVLCIRYEYLWENIERISEFLELPLELPNKRPRADKNIDPDIIQRINHIYSPLDQKYAHLPNVFVAGSL